MTARDVIKAKNRRRMAVLGGAVGAFAAAAAMATGSAVTAAPAKADFEDLLDPIIQPLITSLSDAIAGFDPTAAADLTSWTDSLLASLNSLDVAAPAAADPAAATALAAADTPSGTYDIPLTVQEGTEPLVNVSVDGSTPEATLVDTGSSGLVIPSTNLSLTQWLDLGFPTGISESGYSGGVDYLYLTYDNATVDYGDGALSTAGTPVDVEILSWPTSFSANSPLDFQEFLSDNDSPGGILGIGDGVGPNTESPLQAAGYDGVTVDVTPNGNAGDLIVSSTNVNPGTAIPGDSTFSDVTSGAPITTLFETVTTGGTTTGATVSDDVDSGGVYGTIPSSLVGSSGALPDGSVVTVYSSEGGTELYSYEVTGTEADSTYTGPTAVSGTSIDSGYLPFNQDPIYINYTDDTLTFDVPGSISS